MSWLGKSISSAEEEVLNAMESKESRQEFLKAVNERNYEKYPHLKERMSIPLEEVSRALFSDPVELEYPALEEDNE